MEIPVEKFTGIFLGKLFQYLNGVHIASVRTTKPVSKRFRVQGAVP